MEIINKIIDLDTRTLIGVLFWGNVVATILIYSFLTLNMNIYDKKNIKKLSNIHLLYTTGYLMLLLRETIPDIISVNLGNTILLICFYLEAVLILTMVDTISKNMYQILRYILIITILVFNIMELIFHNGSLRITMASINIFAILCIPTIKLLTAKDKFKFGIGIFYLVFLISIIPRTIISIYGNISLHSNSTVQTLFFLSLIVMMVSSIMTHLLLMKEKNDKMIEMMARTDSLTSISNRWNFMNEAERLLNKCIENYKEISVIFFDIDDFKYINDSYGHRFGDALLIKFAEMLENEYDSPELLCRYGGEEFVAVLYDFNMTECKKSILRVLNAVRECRFDDKPDFQFTVSAGLMSVIPNKNTKISDLIDKGDIAMYAAKRKGKNTYEIYSGEQS